MTEFEKGYEQGYKDGVAGAALPNVNDNGDKIDGYSYAYKTDSNGEPYIHIDSVRGMLKEAKRLLKAAIEDNKNVLTENFGDICQFCKHGNNPTAQCCKPHNGSGSWCCENAEWRYTDEAERLLKGE